MKIIIINNLYSPWVRGGAEKIVERAAAGLEKFGHEVFIIATAPLESRTDRAYYLPSIFYNLEKYPFWQRFFWHFWDVFNFSNAKKIGLILAEKKPELVITHNIQGVGYPLFRLLRKMKIRHFHTLHDVQLLHPSGLLFFGREKKADSLPAKIYQLILRRLIGSPELVISPSQWLLDEHLKRGFFPKAKKEILPNYFFQEISAVDSNFSGVEFSAPPAPFKILYVGQIEEHKGVELLLESFLEFLQNNKEAAAELLVAGGGSRLEEIRRISLDCQAIKILGRKSEGEVEELMLKADCLVVPSLCYENSPTVIYEAIRAGLPVLASEIGGIPELIGAAGGLLFAPGSKNDLAQKIAEVFSSPEKIKEIKIKERLYRPADYVLKLADLAKGDNKV
jgi:glycosyltransferase involved in cell wall biosynthesis